MIIIICNLFSCEIINSTWRETYLVSLTILTFLYLLLRRRPKLLSPWTMRMLSSKEKPRFTVTPSETCLCFQWKTYPWVHKHFFFKEVTPCICQASFYSKYDPCLLDLGDKSSAQNSAVHCPWRCWEKGSEFVCQRGKRLKGRRGTFIVYFKYFSFTVSGK